KDFAIANLYEELDAVVQPLFVRAGVPVFSDTKNLLSDTYIARFLVSLIEAQIFNLRRDKVINLIKSPVFSTDSSSVFAYENRVLKRNISFNGFLNPSEDISEEEIRCKVISLTRRFSGATVQEYISAIKEILEDSEIIKNHATAVESLENEELLKAMNNQAVENINEILAELSALYGNEKMKQKDFCDIFKSSLEAVEISLIPRFIDSVFMGNLTESRYNNIKVLFIAGACANSFPKQGGLKPVVSDMDFCNLSDAGINIFPSPQYLDKEKEFLILDLFTKPTERLYIGLASSLPSGEKLTPAPAVKEICSLLNITPSAMHSAQRTAHNEGLIQNSEFRIQNEGKESAHSAQRTAHNEGLINKESTPLPYALCPMPSPTTNHQSPITNLFFPPSPNGERSFKITEVESFFRCPYSHYLKHGLRLKERESAEAKTKDIGIIFHDALEYYFRKTLKKLRIFSEERLKSLAEESIESALNQYFKGLQNDIFSENFKKQVKREFLSVAKKLTEQVLLSEYEPSFVEAEIGMGKKDFPAIEVFVQDEKFVMRGKADRIDLKGKNASVIDYKTGNAEFAKGDLYFGLKLQLFVYLKSVKNAGFIPAGALYLPIKDSYSETGVDYSMHGRVDASLVSETDFCLKQPKASFISGEEFAGQIDYAVKVTKSALGEMVSGVIAKSPAGDFCVRCEYKEICGGLGTENIRSTGL
ncbi:MAG: PD-(D/E)XK nuclease family protein, partial [Firmicutes bacterium]|nr:PD-(D/E)XK nuclease family protein [Bacillota bacterium]